MITRGSSVHRVAAVQDREIVIRDRGTVQDRAVPKIRRAERVTGAAAADVHSPVESVRGKVAEAEACCREQRWAAECCRADGVEPVSRHTEVDSLGCSRDPTWLFVDAGNDPKNRVEG